MKNESVKDVKVSINKNSRFDVLIKLNLSEQNIYHLERAITNHLESQRALIGNQTKESIEKYGDNKEMFKYLVGFMEPLRNELRKINPEKDWTK